jgi:hypothetical protein
MGRIAPHPRRSFSPITLSTYSDGGSVAEQPVRVTEVSGNRPGGTFSENHGQQMVQSAGPLPPRPTTAPPSPPPASGATPASTSNGD